MKVLIVNAYSNKNAGDAALLETTINQIVSHFKCYSIHICYDFSEELSSNMLLSPLAWVKPGGKWSYIRLILLLPLTLTPILVYRLFKIKIFPSLKISSISTFIKHLIEADIVISKPGGFLYSSGKGSSLILSLYPILLALILNKPVYILPQSIGPLNKKWEGILIKFILSKVRIVFVREKISLETLNRLYVPSQIKIRLAPDLAFLYNKTDEDFASKFLKRYQINKNTPLMGITLIDWARQNTKFNRQEIYELAIKQIIHWFTTSIGGRVLIIPQVTGPLTIHDDRLISFRIYESVKSLQCIFVNEALNPPQLKSIYSNMDIIIASRLHSAIFSWCSYVPVVAIGYQHKTLGVSELLGTSKWVTDINKVTPEDLQKLVETAWIERNAIKNELSRIIPIAVAEARKVFEIIKIDIYEFYGSKNRRINTYA